MDDSLPIIPQVNTINSMEKVYISDANSMIDLDMFSDEIGELQSNEEFIEGGDGDNGDEFGDEGGDDSDRNIDRINVDGDERKWDGDGSKWDGDRDGGEIMGKSFDTMDDAYHWYNQYALKKGFGTRINWNSKSRKTKEVVKKTYVCNKEGFKRRKDNDGFRRNRETKTGCEAMMEIRLNEARKWVISKFIDAHNHPMTTPSKVAKHRSHSNFHRSAACKLIMDDLNSVGVRPCIISRAVNVLTRGDEAALTAKQCSTYINNERSRNIGKECYGIIQHFHEKAVNDDDHFFPIDLGEDGMLRNIFWADGRSRANYIQFGDVLVFDTTYKTNKFKMPFAPFVGVNHHRQSILFGGALLHDETEATFTWLFEQFLKCMHNTPPLSIITDQDRAMGNAIKNVFPNSRHRFCEWHISKHVTEHLASYRAQYDEFNLKYTELIKSNTIEEFESKWESFQREFNIDEDSWLSKMYKMKKHWVRAYLKDHFFAGMTTSGRSESIHSFFDGYLNSNTMLNEFVVKYDVAVKARRNTENDADFRTLNSTAILCTGHSIEKQAAKFYTRAIFDIFQLEWKKSIELEHEKVAKDGDVVKYMVGHPNADRKKWRHVVYETISDTFRSVCSCAKFETEGILCKHILYIIRKKFVRFLPSEYMLDRWSIDARFKFHEARSVVRQYKSTEFTAWSIRSQFNKVLSDAQKHPIIFKQIGDFVRNVSLELSKLDLGMCVEQNVGCSQVASTTVHHLDDIVVHDLAGPVKCKGRPKNATRIKSGLELLKQQKRQIQCRFCGQVGHNSSGCVIKKAQMSSYASNKE